jgi:hypothetical protein
MNRKIYLSVIILALFVFIGGCQTQAATPTPLSATFSELAGQVEARQAGQESFSPVSVDTILEVNGQVQTGNDGRVRLDLSTGTIIRVGPSSSFTLTANEEMNGGLFTRIKLEAGKLFVILSGGSAEVETPSGIASVRGSYMKVEVDPETLDIYITCLEGDCSASNPAGTINFSNGQRTILYHRDPVTGNWNAPNAEPMTPEEFQEWLDENPEAREIFEQAAGTLTALAPPTLQPTLTLTLTVTPFLTASPTLVTVVPPAPASSACFQILAPASGASLPQLGPVTFEWEAQPGAQRYVMTFLDPLGRRATIQTNATRDIRYIEIFPTGGEYSWFVTAIGADGREICSTSAITFTKPQAPPTLVPSHTPKPTDEGPACVYPDDVCNPEYPECYDPDQC